MPENGTLWSGFEVWFASYNLLKRFRSYTECSNCSSDSPNFQSITMKKMLIKIKTKITSVHVLISMKAFSMEKQLHSVAFMFGYMNPIHLTARGSNACLTSA